MSNQIETSAEAPPSAKAKGSLLRSIWAVFAGTLVGVLVTLLTDAVLHAVHVFPPYGQPTTNGPLALATVYRILYSIGASYLIARLAPNKPMLHALVGGFLGLIASFIGAVTTWNHTDVFGPHWYPIALVVTALPCAWVGGKLYASRDAG